MHIKVATGEKCPKGGLWKVLGGSEYHTFSEGEEMPTYRGKMVLWEIKTKHTIH